MYTEKEAQYSEIALSVEALTKDESDIVANLANAAAAIYCALADISWAGFYIMKGDTLVLGPFQGLPACIRIEKGRGVCGRAAEEKRTVVVKDVHSFSGHIACDSRSNSEIVVPIIKNDRVEAVIDIDSTSLSRFDGADAAGLERIASILSNKF